MSIQTPLIVGLGYLLGCFSSAYYLVRWTAGKDIRQVGSGTAGAKNAGRLLGKKGFAVAFLGDLGKGSLAVWIAILSGLSAWGVVFVYVAVVLGHIYPLQLGFRGGKGASTAFGGLLVLNWRLALVVVAVAALIYAISRAFTVSGLVTMILALPLSFLLEGNPAILAGIAMIIGLLLYAHRTNIRSFLQRPAG